MPKQSDGSLHFLFLVKFFPESVKTELIQDLTRFEINDSTIFLFFKGIFSSFKFANQFFQWIFIALLKRF